MSPRAATPSSTKSAKAAPRDIASRPSAPVHPLKPFSLAFADPPYHQGLGERALACARDGGWLTPGAIVVVEEGIGRVTAPEGFEEIERRGYDDTELVFLKAP